MAGAELTLQSLIALVVLLVLLFLSLLGYTFWARQKQKYWQNYEQKFRDYFFSLLLDYTEKNDVERDPNEIIKKIGKRTKDYSFFINLLNDLTNILDGEQRNRLNELIEHPIFLSFYAEKLFKGSTNYKILACIYFQNKEKISDRVSAKLITISKSSNLKLAYSATKSLQSADNIAIRTSALLRFFRRNDVTKLMIVELLHLFDAGTFKDRPIISKELRKILLSNIGIEPKVSIIRYMGNQNYFENSEFLFQFLKRVQYTQHKAPLIQSLITALAKLHHEEAELTIKSYISNKDIDTETQIAATKALSVLGGEKNLAYLTRQLLRVEFPVRKTIINELALHPKTGIDLLNQFVVENLNFLRQFQHQNHPPQHLKKIIEKIRNISRGIKISLMQRLTNTYVQ